MVGLFYQSNQIWTMLRAMNTYGAVSLFIQNNNGISYEANEIQRWEKSMYKIQRKFIILYNVRI